MIVVLDETNVSARLGCGLALASLMMSMERFKLNVAEMQQVNHEETSMITAFGGYVPATANAKELAMEIRKIQMSMLPGDWRTEREKQLKAVTLNGSTLLDLWKNSIELYIRFWILFCYKPWFVILFTRYMHREWREWTYAAFFVPRSV